MIADRTTREQVGSLRHRIEAIERFLWGKSTVPTLHCSFCGKSQHDVRKLIAGPVALICDDCARLTISILDEELPS